MDPKKKVFANRDLNEYELEMIALVFKQNDLEQYLEDSHIFIYVEEDGTEIDIMRYPDETVAKNREELILTTKQTLEYLYSKDMIDQEVAEMLYWAGIDDYKKYVPVIEYKERRGKKEKVYADYYFFAKSDYDAADFMNRNAYFDYLFVEDVDGD